MAIRYVSQPITYEMMREIVGDNISLIDFDGIVLGHKQVPVAMMCDICKSLVTYDEVLSFDNVFHHVDWMAGYGSVHDGTHFNMDICDECMNKFGRLAQ